MLFLVGDSSSDVCFVRDSLSVTSRTRLLNLNVVEFVAFLVGDFDFAVKREDSKMSVESLTVGEFGTSKGFTSSKAGLVFNPLVTALVLRLGSEHEEVSNFSIKSATLLVFFNFSKETSCLKLAELFLAVFSRETFLLSTSLNKSPCSSWKSSRLVGTLIDTTTFWLSSQEDLLASSYSSDDISLRMSWSELTVKLSSAVAVFSSVSGRILSVVSSASLDELLLLLCSSIIDCVLSKSVKLHGQEADGVEQFEHSLNPESLRSLQLRGSLIFSSHFSLTAWEWFTLSSSSFTLVIRESFMWLPKQVLSVPESEGRGLAIGAAAAAAAAFTKFFRDADKVAKRPSALIAFPVFYTSKMSIKPNHKTQKCQRSKAMHTICNFSYLPLSANYELFQFVRAQLCIAHHVVLLRQPFRFETLLWR